MARKIALFGLIAVMGSVATFPSFAFAACQTSHISIVSDTNVNVAGHGMAAAAYDESALWTDISGAQWIWKSEFVENPEIEETYVFEKGFDASNTVTSAKLSIAGDDYYKAFINGAEIASEFGEGNFATVKEFNIPSTLITGQNTLRIEATNAKYFYSTGATPYTNPAGIIFALNIATETCEDSGGGSSGSRRKTSAQTESGVSTTTPDSTETPTTITNGAVQPKITLASNETVATDTSSDQASSTDEILNSAQATSSDENAGDNLLAAALGAFSPEIAGYLFYILIILAILLAIYIIWNLFFKKENR